MFATPFELSKSLNLLWLYKVSDYFLLFLCLVKVFFPYLKGYVFSFWLRMHYMFTYYIKTHGLKRLAKQKILFSAFGIALQCFHVYSNVEAKRLNWFWFTWIILPYAYKIINFIRYYISSELAQLWACCLLIIYLFKWNQSLYCTLLRTVKYSYIFMFHRVFKHRSFGIAHTVLFFLNFVIN